MQDKRSIRTAHNLVVAILHLGIVVFLVGAAGSAVLYLLFLLLIYLVFAVISLSQMDLGECLFAFWLVTGCVSWFLIRMFYPRNDQSGENRDGSEAL